MTLILSLPKRAQLAVVALSIGLFAWTNSAIAQEAPRAPVVTVVRAQEHEMVGQVPVSGTLVARNEVLIYPQVSGYTIEKILVDIGDQVEQGAVLAELNSSTLEAQLAQSVAELARAQASVSQAESQVKSSQASLTQAASVLRRAEQLRASGAGTQASLDQAVANEQVARASVASGQDGLAVAQAQLQQVQAQLDVARLNRARATIVAPVSGLISERTGRLGAIATSGGDPIFRLIAGGEIEVEAEVVETAMSGLKIGNEVSLDIAGIGQVAGQVRLISPVVDPVTRLGTVRITTEPQPDLRSGLFASGWITTVKRTSLSVPARSVLTDGAASYVLKVNDGVVERREVAAGLIWQDQREVLSGLEAGDVVVAKVGAFFADGDMIDPVFADDQSKVAISK